MYINISRIETFLACARKFDLIYRQKKVAKREDRTNLSFGTAIHKGLEVWYDLHRVEEAIQAFYASTGLPDELSGYGDALLRRYFEHYEEEDRRWKVEGTEVNFRTPIGGGRHILVGRLDLIIDAGSGPLGGLWHVQHKTVGKTVGLVNYMQRFMLDFHELAYSLMARRNGVALKGSIINLLRKVDLFDLGVGEPKKRRKSTLLEPNPVFLRERIPLDTFTVDAVDSELASITDLIERGERWKNPQSCFLYNRPCVFHDICTGVSGDLIDDPDFYVAKENDYVDELNTKGGQDAV